MEQVVLLILLVLGVPLVAGIWLVVRAFIVQNQIAELTRRVEGLQAELWKLKRAGGAAPQTAGEKAAEFVAAVLPPQRAETEVPPQAAVPMPVPDVNVPPAPEPAPEVPPPAMAPSLWETAAAAPAELPSKASATPPPIPLIPPLPKPAAPPPVPAPEVAEPSWESPEAAAPPVAEAPAAVEKTSFEMRVGTYWLVRIGIVILVTGLAFGANLAYHRIVPRLGPPEKISLLYLVSGLLLGAGAWWQRRNVKESLKNYAQVLFAGGLAGVYLTTYAAHYAPPVRVIASALLDGTLLFLWAGVIAWIADRRKSEVMALFAVCLAFFSSVITRVGEFTLYSNLILTLAAVVFLVRNRWAGLSLVSLLTSYAGYVVWRFLGSFSWHWAAPDANLWWGAGFLASYWLVFTAATFLSKSENLTGGRRAAFLTLNNGAYFTLFVLTMWQVHTGGFWKFSLVYGAVLLALAAAARRFLPAEPAAKNAYLTQGLVLVTVGFIAKYSGLNLAVVLGAESVVLYGLGSQRRSAVMQGFAFAAAVLAVGWCAATAKYFDAQDFWMSAGLGGLLAANAGWAHRLETRANPESRRLASSAFALLAFAAWVLAAWFNTPEQHLPVAVVLAVAGVVFYGAIGGYRAAAPKVVAFASGAAAVGWWLATAPRLAPTGLEAGAAIGALLLLNACRAHREGAASPQLLRPEPTAWALAALAAWLGATWYNTTEAHLPLVLTAEAVALTFSIYVVRVREVTLLGQLFLVIAQVTWLYHFQGAKPPWWNPLAIIAVTIGLSHWWQHQKSVAVNRDGFAIGAAVYALAAVGVALVWLHPLVGPPGWLVLTGLLAAGVTVYGLVTRAWAVAIAGQIFLAVGAWEFVRQLLGARPEWYFPLAPLAVLGAFSLGTVVWFARQGQEAPAREPLLQVALIYRWLALALSLLWVWDYVGERQRVWAYMLAAAWVFAAGLWRNSREGLAAAAVYAAASLALLWGHEGLAMDLYGPNLVSLLALLVMQQLLRLAAARLPVAEGIHGGVVLVAGASLWRYLSCWTAQAGGGFTVTMTWAGLAVAVFAAGMLLHERFYRWFGLGVLATAVGRVVLVDVWKEEPMYRVMTFMALGVALLVVGFLYNKYQEKIRQWL